jgi:hypothetical protein
MIQNGVRVKLATRLGLGRLRPGGLSIRHIRRPCDGDLNGHFASDGRVSVESSHVQHSRLHLRVHGVHSRVNEEFLLRVVQHSRLHLRVHEYEDARGRGCEVVSAVTSLTGLHLSSRLCKIASG